MDSVRGQDEDVRPRTSMHERRDTGLLPAPKAGPSGREDGTWLGGRAQDHSGPACA